MSQEEESDWQESVVPLFGGQCWNQSYYHHACGNIKVRAKESNSNPLLFADDIWPGSVLIADFLAEHCKDYCYGKHILELGAGTALPSLVCAKLGCRGLVISDYPDDDILCNITNLLTENEIDVNTGCIYVRGHKWGENVEDLLLIENTNTVSIKNGSSSHTWTETKSNAIKFDLIILAELLWKDTYSQHKSLLQSVAACLSDNGHVLVGFAHRPTEGLHTCEQDLEFFTMAETEFGLKNVLLLNKHMEDSFAGDDGPVQVNLYELSYSHDSASDG